MFLDYIFIGAGPASLSAGYFLNKYSTNNFLIIEQGKNTRKTCPAQNLAKCINCNTNCLVTNGIGGASASYGNKLCYFPASPAILNYFSKKTTKQVLYELDKEFKPFFSKNLCSIKSYNNTLKKYVTDILFQEDYSSFINHLIKNNQNNILDNTKFIDFKYNKNDTISVLTDKGKFICKHLIFSTGRNNSHKLKLSLNRNDIEYSLQEPDIGFRLELKTQNLTKNFFYQADPKFKIIHNRNSISRTFCTCKGGVIVPVKYKNFFQADGAFLKKATSKTNFAIMSRLSDGINITDIDQWISDINNRYKGLYIDSIELMKNNIVNELLEYFDPWPTIRLRSNIKKILTFLFDSNNNFFKNDSSENINIFGPSIDNYWIKPHIGQNLKIKDKNIYFLGDSAGLSRGIVQAIYSGAAWAIQENSNFVNYSEDINAIWSRRIP